MLFNIILLHSVDILIITKRLLHLITKFIAWGFQPQPRDGDDSIDDYIKSLQCIAREGSGCFGGAQAAAAGEVVRASHVPLAQHALS